MKLPLNLTFKVDLDDIQNIIDEIKGLQTYKLAEDDKMILIERAALVEILQRHLRVKEK